jgi:hypothetical protein
MVVSCHSDSEYVRNKTLDTCVLTDPDVVFLGEPEDISLAEPAKIFNILRFH